MKHLHFDTIPSTQDYLIDNFETLGSAETLVSCKSQTKGRGRGQNSWDSYQNSLAFSFLANTCENITLTPLEVACVLLKFTSKSRNLKLKWPNDILDNDNKKCAGILVQVINNKALIGVGINWGVSSENHSYKTGKSFICNQNLQDSEYETIPKQFYEFFLNSRLANDEIITTWTKNCAHLNQKVLITEDNKVIEGIFTGIGPFGEAIIKNENGITKIYNGSLTIV